MMSPEEILRIIQNQNLRWQDDIKGLRIAMRLLKHPDNESKQKRFEKRLRKKVINYMNSNDCFFGNYPYPSTLPNFERGRIPLCALPTEDILSINAKELTKNLIICGSSGGGKTNILKGIIRFVLEAGGSVIAFDRKGKCELADCKILLGSDLPVHIWRWNELRLAPLQPIENIPIGYWANLITSLLSSQWSLIASTTLLMEIVHEFYKSDSRTWDKLLGKAVSFKGISHRSDAYKDVLVRNLKSVYLAFGEVINATESNVIEKMTQEKACHIITTDGLIPEHASLLSAFFVIRDYEIRRLSESLQNNLVCYVLDDSMALLKETNQFQEGTTINPLNTIAFMGRSLGMSLIISAQNFSQVSTFFKNNCGTLIACNSSGEDCYALGRYMNLNEEQTANISELSVGEVVCLAKSEWVKAVKGRYPLLE